MPAIPLMLMHGDRLAARSGEDFSEYPARRGVDVAAAPAGAAD